jgi:hypothetical protein
MHVRDLVELGALVAAHGTLFVQHSKLLTQRHMQQYWLASRYRHDRWFQAMRTYERATPTGKQDHWPFIQAVVEEVLASELLTRTWAAVGCSFDSQHGSSDFEPLVRSVLVGHLEARNRVLHLLVRAQGFSVKEGVRLNRLRRQTERWTDLMLGYLACTHNVDDFAFNPELVREFAADLGYEKRSTADDSAWTLTLASLRSAYHSNLHTNSPHGELNQRIAASILACFHSDLSDSLGALKSHWMVRLSQITEETQGLVEDLLKVDETLLNRFTARR